MARTRAQVIAENAGAAAPAAPAPAGNGVQKGRVAKAIAKAKPKRAARSKTATEAEAEPDPEAAPRRKARAKKAASSRRKRAQARRASASSNVNQEDGDEAGGRDQRDAEAEAAVPPQLNAAPEGNADDGRDEDADAASDNIPDTLTDEYANAVGVGPDLETEIPFEHEGSQASLRITLRVHEDTVFASRLGYAVRLYLVRQPAVDETAPAFEAAAANRSDAPNEAVPPDEAASTNEDPPAPRMVTVEQVGYVHGWRMLKATAADNERNSAQWVEDFLAHHPNNVVESGSETAWCLQALYTQNGALKPAQRARNAELNNNDLLFIEMIYIFNDHQRRGHLRRALIGLYRLLQALPEPSAFTGTIVLVPCAPKGPRGQVWEGVDDAVVEERLRRVYEGQDYEVWANDVRVRGLGGRMLTVMGRTMP